MPNEYTKRINLTFDYIEKNLGKTFTLEELAAVASFSKYHFTRIFYSLTGETPFQYITRIRMEKAAFMMIANPEWSVTDIALTYGYNDLTVFSRNFKKYFLMTPTQFRESKKQDRNLSRTDRNSGQMDEAARMYFCPQTNQIKWRTNMELNKSMEVKELPTMNVAYIRHMGPYQGDDKLFENLFNRLFKWAGSRGLLEGGDFETLVVYHDDPNMTDEQKLKMSVCVTVPENTKTDGEIGQMKIEGGKYAVGRFEVDTTQFGEAWGWMFGQWLPKSGYQPDDKPAFEMYPEEPKGGKFVVDICVPVKAL